jgi:hypothetical protein
MSFADFLEAQTAAEQEKGASKLAALRRDEEAAGKVPAAPGTTATAPKQPDAAADPNAPIEERAKAKWEGDAKLRAEFAGDFKSYLAFAKAEEGGKVKILRKA